MSMLTKRPMLKQELQEKNMDEGAFRDDAKVSYYTGQLTCQVLHVLLVFLQSFLLS